MIAQFAENNKAESWAHLAAGNAGELLRHLIVALAQRRSAARRKGAVHNVDFGLIVEAACSGYDIEVTTNMGTRMNDDGRHR